MKSIFITLLAFISFVPPAWSLGHGQWFLGAGPLAYHTYKVTSQDSAATSLMNDVHFPFQLRSYWDGFSGYYFSPRLAYTVLPSTSQDGNSTRTLMLLSLPLTSPFGQDQSWNWSTGLSIIRYTIDGKGGLVTLNNGTGTSTFARPGRSTTSQVLALELGLGQTMTPILNWQLDALVEGFLTNRRSLSLFFTLNYQLGAGSGI